MGKQNHNVKYGRWCHEGTNYSVKKLVKRTADNPVVKYKVKRFTEYLTRQVWRYSESRQHSISPQFVLRNRFPLDHFKRILAANLKYPIMIVKLDGMTYIVDGYHRLARAVKDERDTIECVEVTKEQLAAAKVK